MFEPNLVGKEIRNCLWHNLCYACKKLIEVTFLHEKTIKLAAKYFG